MGNTILCTLLKKQTMNFKFHLIILVIIFGLGFTFTSNVNTSDKSKSLIESLHFHKGKRLLYLSAHRGGRYIRNLPENAIATFEHTLSRVPNAILEMDVSITQDNQLILMHDKSLDRTTTTSGIVAQKKWADIKDAMLVDDFGAITPYFIPTFEEVLKWAKPRGVILKIDIKRGVPYKKVIRAIEKMGMTDKVILITYTIDGAKEAYAITKKMMISASIRNMQEWKRIKATGIPYKNLIAFTGTRMSDPQLYKTLHKYGILCILGTMGNIDQKALARGEKVYHGCLNLGVDMLATDKPDAAKSAIRSFNK